MHEISQEALKIPDSIRQQSGLDIFCSFEMVEVQSLQT